MLDGRFCISTHLTVQQQFAYSADGAWRVEGHPVWSVGEPYILPPRRN